MGEMVKTEEHLFSVKEEPLAEATNILIEIDEVLMKFLNALEVGSLLSLSELLSLASRTECEHCGEVFYSNSLYQQHQETHGETKPIVVHIQKNEMDPDELAFLDEPDDKYEDDKDWSPKSKPAKTATDTRSQDDKKDLNPSEEKATIKSSKANIKSVSSPLKKDKPKHSCEQCGKQFVSLGAFNNHMAAHKGEKPASHARAQYVLYLKNGDFQCTLCKKTFNDRQRCRDHISIHMEVLRDREAKGQSTEVIRCPICHWTLPHFMTMERHRLLAHDPIKKCEFCEESFETAKELKIHERKHNNQKYNHKVTCEDCGQTFQKNSIKHHRAVYHGDGAPPPRPPPVFCDQCGKSFYKKYHMLKHRLIHMEKKYFCTFPGCSQGFPLEDKFKLHLNTHFNIYPYTCETCGKGFIEKKDLSKHRQIHGEAKRHCPFCSKSFKQHATLYRHKLSCHLNPDK